MTEVQGYSLVERTLAAEETIKFGAAVKEGAAVGGAVNCDDIALFAGVAMTDDARTTDYDRYDPVRVCKLGMVPMILEKLTAAGNPEALPEGTPVKISATVAGQIIKGAVGATMFGRLAEDGSFLAAPALGTTHVRLVVVGVN